MRKNYKRLTAMLMTSAIALSAGMTAMTAYADDAPTYSITMNTTTGHTYTAYQVFSGTIDKTATSLTLHNIEWASGVNSTDLLAALKNSTKNTYAADFTSCTTAADVAKVLDGYEEDDVKIQAVAKLIEANKGTASSGLTGLSAGYYLIIDTTSSLPKNDTDKKSDTLSRFMLKVVEDVNVTAKDGVVESHKTVTETDDSTSTTTPGQKVADYDIGDSVPYELTFKLPSNFTDYVNYPITFTDDMCAGLSWNGNAKIYYGASDTIGTDITFSKADGTSFTGGQKWTFTTDDLRAAGLNLGAGDVIKVTYNATLNSNAAFNDKGNQNKYHVSFYNNPNKSTTPTTPSGETPPTGDTPDDTTVVFTYELVFNKVDEKNAALKGADFKLEKKVGSTWFDVTAIHTGEGAINPTKTGDDSGNVFSFKGLDAGAYRLTETKKPTGYNQIDPIEFTVVADRNTGNTTVEGLSSTVLTMNPAFDESNAKLEANIVNQKGITLPGTGGIGTALFYTAGTLLIAGGATLLITKKRMNVKEK